MYGPVILLLCARPGDDLIGATGAILRAREQGSIVTAYMMSSGLLPPARWKFWGKNSIAERTENIMDTTRRIAVDYGHQFVGWNGTHMAGSLANNLPALALDIERAFVSVKPDVVWTPAYLGLDPDYDALNVIASRLPQLAQSPVDIYEYIPRPIQRQAASGAGGTRAHVVFPNRHGMELSVNLTQGETGKRSRAIEALSRVYDEKLTSSSDRELFRLLPQHDYRKPPYGYKNSMMMRGNTPGDALARAVVPRMLQLLRAPVSRQAHLDASLNMPGSTPLHHLPQG